MPQQQTIEIEAFDVDETCARLRKILLETRGIDRRGFIAALGRTLAGSAALSLLPYVTPADAAPAELPVTAFVFGGVWKKSAMTAFGEPFTKATGIPVVYRTLIPSRSFVRCTRPRPCRSTWCPCRVAKSSRPSA
jgi:hypothetical protein